MSRAGANIPCPCGAGRKYKKCCRPIHDGVRLAETPEQLMRSRYSAYATGRADWIMASTHPAGPHFSSDPTRWRQEIEAFCRDVSFDGLEVLETEAREGRGIVDFRAQLSKGDEATVMAERSLFLHDGARWLYHSGLRRD